MPSTPLLNLMYIIYLEEMHLRAQAMGIIPSPTIVDSNTTYKLQIHEYLVSTWKLFFSISTLWQYLKENALLKQELGFPKLYSVKNFFFFGFAISLAATENNQIRQVFPTLQWEWHTINWLHPTKF